MTERAAVRRSRRGTRRRRVVAVIAMGALAVGILGACRSEAGTAAFVGNSRITDAQIDSTATPAATVKNATTNLQVARQEAVIDLVFNDIAKKYAAENKITLSDPPADLLNSLASGLATIPSDPLVKAIADSRTWMTDLANVAPTVTPTDADLMAVYQQAVDAGLAPAGQFAQNKAAIEQFDGLGKALGLQRELIAAEKSYNVTINPRYLDECAKAPCKALYFPLLVLTNQSTGQTLDAVVLPLGGPDASPAVLDSPAPTVATDGPVGGQQAP